MTAFGIGVSLQPVSGPRFLWRLINEAELFVPDPWRWVLLSGLALAADQPNPLRAGTARKDITPTKPVVMMGYDSRKEPSKGIHDPLFVRVIAFEQNGKHLVLVSTDNLGYYGGTADRFRKTIAEACHLQPSEFFLSAIHTHSAPSLAERNNPNNIEYIKTLETRLVEVVREALDHAVPVQIGFASGSSPVGVNRREVVKDAAGHTSIVLGRNPVGPTDPEVQVLKLSREGSSDPLAVLFAYATHSTSLGPRNYLISGDVHGLAEQFVEKQLDGVIVPGFAGTSGNIDPWFRVLPTFDTTKDRIPEPVLLGTMLGEEVVQVARTIRKPIPGGPIATAFKTLELPAKPPDPGSVPKGAKPRTFNVTVGRVGPVAFVGLGGEVFNEIGKAIKQASPFPTTIIITHCNGTAGYLPIKSSYPEGGYEVRSSAFGPDAAEQVIKETVQLLKQLQ